MSMHTNSLRKTRQGTHLPERQSSQAESTRGRCRHFSTVCVVQAGKLRMAKIDVTKVWALNYRLVTSVIVEVAPALHELGIEVKELFLLAGLDAHPHPAALAEALLMP